MRLRMTSCLGYLWIIRGGVFMNFYLLIAQHRAGDVITKGRNGQKSQLPETITMEECSLIWTTAHFNRADHQNFF